MLHAGAFGFCVDYCVLVYCVLTLSLIAVHVGVILYTDTIRIVCVHVSGGGACVIDIPFR